MCADKVLMDLFYGDVDEVALVGPPPSAGYHHSSSFLFDADNIDSMGEYGNVGGLINQHRPTYLEAVKELIHDERQFIRDLNLIIKVFRDPLTSVLPPNNIEKIFVNIDEILEFSNNFLFSLEDAIEVSDEEECPGVGLCFEDFAEDQEFDVFAKYATDVSNITLYTCPTNRDLFHQIMSFHLREHLYQLLSQDYVFRSLHSIGPQMLAALRYVLPQLLLVPVYHCFSHFSAIQKFKDLTSCKEDRDSFEQAEALMLPLKSQLEKIIKSNKFGNIPYI